MSIFLSHLEAQSKSFGEFGISIEEAKTIIVENVTSHGTPR